MLFLHVFLAYPSGRLEGRPERVLVAAGYFAGIGLQLVKMLLAGSYPDNLLGFWDSVSALNTVEDVQLISISAFLLAGIPVLIAKRRRTGRPLRRWTQLLVDSFALALVMLALLLLAGAFAWPSFETIRRITFVTIGFSPIAFLIGLMSARLARSTVGDLLIQLHSDPAPGDLPELFGRALRDPSLTVAYWLPQYGTWADPDGRSVELPAEGSGRATTVIERDGVRLAALVHDPSLDDEPELLDAVSAAAGIALENGRLQAELRARLEELRGSRERVLEAGQRERQRLERNLHDGAQQRLIALSLDLSMLEQRLGDDPDARAQIDLARGEIAQSLEELREVAHGLHPAVVSGHGLGVALESLAAGAPVPVRLEVELQERVDEALEVAAYYVVSESLANIGKHAQATSATIAVARANGAARGRDRGQRRRRRRHRERHRATRAGRPRRGARRPPAGVDPARWRDARAGGAAVRVAIAEDSVLLREGVARLLAEGGFDVIGKSGDAEDLMLKVRSYEPDIAIVDIRLPPSHTDEGLQAALQIRERHPGVSVLVLSQYVELGLALKLLSDSAESVGYLLKDRISDVDDFLGAVRRVADGGSAVDPKIVSTLISRQRDDDPLAVLTPREREVLELMATGRSNQGIADKLVITLRAVEKYVSSIFGKLGLPSSGSESRRVLAVLTFLRT